MKNMRWIEETQILEADDDTIIIKKSVVDREVKRIMDMISKGNVTRRKYTQINSSITTLRMIRVIDVETADRLWHALKGTCKNE